VGNLARVTQADGSCVAYFYDAAHRLTDRYDTAGNGIAYLLDG
jgi:YD repeat-containing protein